MNVEQLYINLLESMKRTARQFADEQHPCMSADDLLQVQAERLCLVLQKRPDLAGEDLRLYALKACRAAVVEVWRGANRQCRKNHANPVALNQYVDAVASDLQEEKQDILEQQTDGTYEKFMAQLEHAERVRLLRGIERRVALEMTNPRPRTLAAYQDEVNCLRQLQLHGKPVRVHDRLQARHIAAGLRVPVQRVEAALRNIRTAWAAAA